MKEFINNCRIQFEEVEGKNICTIDTLSNSNKWFEVSLHLTSEQAEYIKNLINFINDNLPRTKV